MMTLLPSLSSIFHSSTSIPACAADPAILQHRREGAEKARKRHEQAQTIAEKLDANPLLAERVVAKLSADTRRELLVVASGKEWYPSSALQRFAKICSSSHHDETLHESSKIHEATVDASIPVSTTITHEADVEQKKSALHRLRRNKHLSDADADADNRISERDYYAWVQRVVAKRESVPTSALIRLALYAACPFVAFGFMDNCVMLVSGDYIEGTIGERFRLTTMAAAALGGIVSGTFGMQIHGIAEKVIEKVGLQPPTLTATQMKHPHVFRAGHAGGTIGIVTGLTLGMLPLLFIEPEHNKRDEQQFLEQLEHTD